MKKHIFFGFLQFIGTYAYAQCECYSVQNIEVTTDTTIAVTLKNTCDNNVYMNGYLIDLSNDTIARNECWCIAASPLLEEAKFDFTSKTSILPALSTLRLSITNGTLVCPSIAFSTPLSYDEVSEVDLRLSPNPLKHQLYLDGNAKIYGLRIFSVLGLPVEEVREPSKVVDLSHLGAGIYFAEIQIGKDRTLKRKIVLE